MFWIENIILGLLVGIWAKSWQAAVACIFLKMALTFIAWAAKSYVLYIIIKVVDVIFSLIYAVLIFLLLQGILGMWTLIISVVVFGTTMVMRYHTPIDVRVEK